LRTSANRRFRAASKRSAKGSIHAKLFSHRRSCAFFIPADHRVSGPACISTADGFYDAHIKIALRNSNIGLAQGLDEDLRQRGRLTNLTLIRAYSPVALRVYGAWFALKDALSTDLADREIFILSLAISETQGSDMPMGFFRRTLARDPAVVLC
jgi:hypothetical protein